MIPSNLTSALANRKKYVDEVTTAEEVYGTSAGSYVANTSNIKYSSTDVLRVKSDTGYTGLENQGATCYLNSLLQSLFMCHEFREKIFSFDYNPNQHGEEEMCLTRQIQILFAQLQLSVKSSVSTKGLTNSFGWSSADSFTQQDVQECMAVIFDFIEKQAMGSKLESFFSDFWQGEYTDSLTCRQCSSSRGNVNRFIDMQLQVKSQGTIEQSLATYIEKEHIEGIECPKCSTRTDHDKGFHLKKLPYFLSFQLKRFDLNYTTWTREKISESFTFPSLLNMTTYMDTSDARSDGSKHYGEGNGGVCPSATDQDIDDRLITHVPGDKGLSYSLVAVLIHSGSAFSGHYFCYVKNNAVDLSDAESRNKQWLCFNDANVTYLSEEEVINALGFPVTTSLTESDTLKSDSSSIEVGDPSSVTEVAALASESYPTSIYSLAKPTSTYAQAASNAYMLIYRRVSDDNLNTVPDERIPIELRERINRENKEFLQYKEQYELEKSYLSPTIFMHKKSVGFRVHSSSTVGEFTNQVYEKYVEDIGALNALTSADSTSTATLEPIPLRSSFRLRIYDSIKGVLQEPLGCSENREDPDSVQLSQIADYILRRPFRVEIATTGNGFTKEMFYHDTIPLEAVLFNNLYDVESNANASPFIGHVSFTFGASMSLADLRDMVIQTLLLNNTTDLCAYHIPSIESVDLDRVVICKLNSSSGVVTELTCDRYRYVIDFLYSDDVLHVEIPRMHPSVTTTATATSSTTTTSSLSSSAYFNEVASDDSKKAIANASENKSPMLRYFDTVQNSIKVSYSGDLFPGFEVGECTIDQRMTLASLKNMFCDRFNVDINSFRIHKGSYSGDALSEGKSGSESDVVVESADKSVLPLSSSSQVISKAYMCVGRELKDLDQTLLECGIENNSKIALIKGQPLHAEQFRFQLYVVKYSDDLFGQNLNPSSAIIAQNPSIDYIDEIIVMKNEIVFDLKKRLLLDLILPHCDQHLPPSPNIRDNDWPIRLRWSDKPIDSIEGGISEDGTTNTSAYLDAIRSATVLRDAYTFYGSLQTNLHQIADGQILVAEVGPNCAGFLTSNHVYLSINQWILENDKLSTLSQPIDVLVSKSMTFGELKELIKSKFMVYQEECLAVSAMEIVSPITPVATDSSEFLNAKAVEWDDSNQGDLEHTNATNQDRDREKQMETYLAAVMEVSEAALPPLGLDPVDSLESTSGEQKASSDSMSDEPLNILLVKPFSWQLKDMNTLPTLKWAATSQPSDLDVLGLSPWRIDNKANIVFTNEKIYNRYYKEDSDVPTRDAVYATYGSTVREQGFKIYTVDEQLKRRDQCVTPTAAAI